MIFTVPPPRYQLRVFQRIFMDFCLEFGEITIGIISHVNFTHLKIYFSFDDVFDYFERNYTILVNVIHEEHVLVSLTVSHRIFLLDTYYLEINLKTQRRKFKTRKKICQFKPPKTKQVYIFDFFTILTKKHQSIIDKDNWDHKKSTFIYGKW